MDKEYRALKFQVLIDSKLQLVKVARIRVKLLRARILNNLIRKRCKSNMNIWGLKVIIAFINRNKQKVMLFLQGLLLKRVNLIIITHHLKNKSLIMQIKV